MINAGGNKSSRKNRRLIVFLISLLAMLSLLMGAALAAYQHGVL